MDNQKIIEQHLKEIEENEHITILLAVESGSRAWGYPSEDSDYDVRFVYIRKKEWYLSIDTKQDVIERTDDQFEYQGWDIRKTLKLFSKCNPSIMEWISSPYIYVNELGFLERLQNLVPSYFSEKASMYHYLNMSKTNYRIISNSEHIKIKSYFYALRALLACQWIDQNHTISPMFFDDLLRHADIDNDLEEEINQLIIRKKQGVEYDVSVKTKEINHFISTNIQYYETLLRNISSQNETEIKPLNELFLSLLNKVG